MTPFEFLSPDHLKSLTLASWLFYALVAGGALALGVIIWNYAKGLRGSPRELWLIILYKFIEYSAYAAMNMARSRRSSCMAFSIAYAAMNQPGPFCRLHNPFSIAYAAMNLRR